MTGFLRRDNKAMSSDAAEIVAPADQAPDSAHAVSGDSVGGSGSGSVISGSVDGTVGSGSVSAASAINSDAETGVIGREADVDSAGEQRVASEPAASTGSTPTTKTVRWLPAPSIRKGYGGSAVSFALAGLATSFFVGWAFPLALIGVALGIVAVRKPEESSRLGVWGIALGILATIYSAGWLWWAGTQLHWFA